MNRGRGLSAALTVVLIAAASGCSPEPKSVAGITVQEDGRIIGLISMCEGYRVDKFNLSASDGTSGNVTRTWTPRRPLGGVSQVELLGDAKPLDWKSSTGRIARLDPSKQYDFNGNEHDRAALTARVSFTASEIDHLPPGKIWLGSYRDDNGYHKRIVSAADFAPANCD